MNTAGSVCGFTPKLQSLAFLLTVVCNYMRVTVSCVTFLAI